MAGNFTVALKDTLVSPDKSRAVVLMRQMLVEYEAAYLQGGPGAMATYHDKDDPLGAPAEYGNLTGAVYNIVTRQGTNQFHGDVNFFLQTDGLTSNNSDGLVNPDGSFVNACPDG